MNQQKRPPSVSLPKAKARIVLEATEELQLANAIDADTARLIREAIRPLPFDWRRLARYAFILAVVCVVIAISAALADQWLMGILRQIFSMRWGVRSLGCAIISAGVIAPGSRLRQRHPERIYSSEAILFLGVLGIAESVYCLGRAVESENSHYSLLVLFAAIVYGLLGAILESKLIWTFSLISIGGWFGAETGYASGWGAYYLGMAYPLRFVVFGLGLSVAGFFSGRLPRVGEFLGLTRCIGLLYLFLALWILSIWGNCDGFQSWHEATHFQLLGWSVLFGLASATAIYLGLKRDDSVLRGFGLTFLGINLYTRYFEYFWEGVHKAIFFAILAVSFWVIGSRAEIIWRMDPLRRRFHSDI